MTVFMLAASALVVDRQLAPPRICLADGTEHASGLVSLGPTQGLGDPDPGQARSLRFHLPPFALASQLHGTGGIALALHGHIGALALARQPAIPGGRLSGHRHVLHLRGEAGDIVALDVELAQRALEVVDRLQGLQDVVEDRAMEAGNSRANSAPKSRALATISR